MAADLATRAEAFLFMEGGSLALKKLASLLGCDKDKLQGALQELSTRLQDRGLSLIVSDTEATLAVAPTTSQEIKAAYERELGSEIGDAGLEVLSIVLYRGPSTRSQIDYVRGVNSSSTIRTLLQRGLVERAGNPEDSREYVYRPTTELLAHLGVRTREELPDYEGITKELRAFEENAAKEQNDNGESVA